MTTPDLQRTAYTVECFLNALRLEDSATRTALEESLVQWLAAPVRRKEDHLIYQANTISAYSQGRVLQQFAVALARQTHTLWCNGAKLSILDADAFARSGQRVMLGTSGLLLGMPGSNPAAVRETPRNSNNNKNNNNNHNNG